jgi:hypothetical protein
MVVAYFASCSLADEASSRGTCASITWLQTQSFDVRVRSCAILTRVALDLADRNGRGHFRCRRSSILWCDEGALVLKLCVVESWGGRQEICAVGRVQGVLEAGVFREAGELSSAKTCPHVGQSGPMCPKPITVQCSHIDSPLFSTPRIHPPSISYYTT